MTLARKIGWLSWARGEEVCPEQALLPVGTLRETTYIPGFPS
jgi:hypothetical protein